MSDYPLPPAGSYEIENVHWTEQLVTVGADNAIDGIKKLFGGVQVWHLTYDDNGLATFRGSSADMSEGKYIAVDWRSYTLIYSETPSAFTLQRDGDGIIPIFRVSIAGPISGYLTTWQLPSPGNGTPIKVVPVNSNESDGMKWSFKYLSE